MAEKRDLAALREGIRAPREDVETQAGHFTARRRPAARGKRR